MIGKALVGVNMKKKKNRTKLRSAVLQSLTWFEWTYGKSHSILHLWEETGEKTFYDVHYLAVIKYDMTFLSGVLLLQCAAFPWYSLDCSHAKNMYSSLWFSFPK